MIVDTRILSFVKNAVLIVGSFLALTKAFSEESYIYRPAHGETCYEIKEHKIECGRFNASSIILSKKYGVIANGADVRASFSAGTHPGDYPFLRRLAIRLGYVDFVDLDSYTNKTAFLWEEYDLDFKNKIIDRYSMIANTPEMKRNLSEYLRACIDYWVDPNATYNERSEDPTLAEVAALCVADSGVL
ncbi:hypothetical protein RE428_41240 [Marinobacter nanhaiticus D15-8W]|uniref:Uncharacterized protein n=1 Tax=Marinobacter nanhaiticus D15-8W TaxID=626887 RepID=N6W708_9GAMM|nr:hypothetical protein [Marinobacter nanhaiticus]ENO16034.1 hypothetical protein J057_11796 [Marinobacter nanhaiticus D15-8W]BES73106.1 hypothetical protein RE428_41240 [Marinobacter nanhaiticus D15-8W]